MTSIAGVIFRATSCRGIRKKKGKEKDFGMCPEDKDNYNKITAILILLPILSHKKVGVKIQVGVIILILRTKNIFINKALNKFEQKTREKSNLFIKRSIKLIPKWPLATDTTCDTHILHED